jgi:hypothetical protein
MNDSTLYGDMARNALTALGFGHRDHAEQACYGALDSIPQTMDTCQALEGALDKVGKVSTPRVPVGLPDKNRGPVVYSKDLYREQCRLHLEDDKGTYGKVEKTKDDILEDVPPELKGILIPFKKHGEGWKAV